MRKELERCRPDLTERHRSISGASRVGLAPLTLNDYNRYVMSTPAPDDTPWVLFEVLKHARRPVSDQFRNPADANAEEQALIGRQLRLLAASGIPPGSGKISPLLEPWFKWKDPDGDSWQVYVLKAKPSHWRLYCCVSHVTRREIVFLHAVKKKENKRDRKDRQACKRVLDGLHSGRYGAASLPIPGS